MKSLQKFLAAIILAGILLPWNMTAQPKPSPNIDGSSSENIIHVVGKGDTIYSISKFYRVDSNELMKINNISDPSKLKINTKLIIPSSASFTDAPVQENKGNSNSSANIQSLTNYKVISGDTLFGLARNYGITVQNLRDINNFSAAHVIKTGDVIKVPNLNQPVQSNKNTVSINDNKSTAVSGLYSLRWPVKPVTISYMTDQMGIVINGELHESVKSITKGKVVSAGPFRKYGKVAIIEAADGYFYMYGGCEKLAVNVGDKITNGMELGKLGVNASSDKPQLFFMVFKKDAPIDPAKAPRAD